MLLKRVGSNNKIFLESGAADSMQPSALLRPPNTELERPDPTKARRCHFGTLDFELGDVALSGNEIFSLLATDDITCYLLS